MLRRFIALILLTLLVVPAYAQAPTPAPATSAAAPAAPTPAAPQPAVETPATAPLQAVPTQPVASPVPTTNEGLAKDLVASLGSHNWRYAAILASIAFIWLVRFYGSKVWPWLGRDRGGAVLVLVTSVAETLLAYAASGSHFTVQLVLNGIQMACSNAGGYVLLKKILPSLPVKDAPPVPPPLPPPPADPAKPA
jgi:hypothetical protein